MPGNGNIWHPLAGSHHAADDQQPRAVLSAAVLKLRSKHHRLHGAHQNRDDPAYCPPDATDEEDAGYSAEAQGDPGQIQGQIG